VRLRGLGGIVGLIFGAPQIDSDCLSGREPTCCAHQHQSAPAADVQHGFIAGPWKRIHEVLMRECRPKVRD
jgi:hypothetical protein